MFKAFGDFINRTPWWAMILLGFSTLLLLVIFSAPVQVIRMSESGSTPEERRAIKREIDRAVGDSALGMAEQIVGAIKDRSTDPARQQEMARALEESFIIVGWVANWKPMETFLYDWWPLKRRRDLYRRLAAASVKINIQ